MGHEATDIACESIVDFLSRPRSYPSSPVHVDVITTEESWIARAGEYVYKVRRPVKFDARDFTTPALRERACLREVRLNRRLGGDIYLDVVPIHLHGGRYSFQRAGEAVDYAIRMRQLPDHRMMDRVLEAGGPNNAEVEALVDLLAEFYASARTASATCKAGTRASLDASARQNLKTLREYLPDSKLLDPIESAQLVYLGMAGDQIDRRIAQGKIRDGHGTLRSDHICLLDPPVVIGCVETRDKERQADILFDVASLFVDLEMRGRADVAANIWTRLAARLSETNVEPLLAFHQSLRAMAQARLEAVRPTQNQDVRDRCQALVRHARELTARFYSPRIIITIGLMAAGKSTLALALAGEFGLERIASEEVRKTLSSASNAASPADRFDRNQQAEVLELMITQARASLARGVSVVLDAGFLRQDERQAALSLAKELSAQPIFLDCRLSKSDALARLNQRFKKNRSNRASRPERFDEQSELFEPIDELPADIVHVLNMSQPVPHLVETVGELL